jgi:uncharacterized protein involved in response to NO
MVTRPVTGPALRINPAPAFFEGGFRPFFLMAGAYAAFSILAWVPLAHGHYLIETVLPLPWWHAHEMVFGFGAAALAGFLLTAVPNWIDSGPVRGPRLALLAALWVAGRAAAWTAPAPLFAALDLAFLPALAALIAPGIIVRSGRRNGVFVLLLAILWGANLATHLAALGVADSARWGLMLGIAVLLTAIGVIGGRIVPAFTIGGMRMAGRPLQIAPSPRLDLAAVLGVAATGLAEAAGAPLPLLAAVAGFAAVANAVRLVHWQGWRTLAVPLVWVLHVGYAWLVVGLGLKALGALDLVPATAAVHALTAGAIGTMVMAVMTRASLGHTGRVLQASRGTVVAYLLLTAGAVLRVAGPLVGGGLERELVGVSGLVWAAGWLAFVACYAPILLRPRAPGPARC